MECRVVCRRVAALCAVWIAVAVAMAGPGAGVCHAVTAQPAAEAVSPEASQAPPAVEPAPPEELTFFQWMEKARAGDAEAQCNIGVFYVNGQGVPRDYKTGLDWLYKAGNVGQAHAQYLMASMYSKGFGQTPSDPFRTWFWAALAAGNSTVPETERAQSVTLMTAAEKALTAKDLATAQKMAKDWWEGRAAAPR